jgi:hypothetical protein
MAGLQPGHARRIKLGKFEWPDMGSIQWSALQMTQPVVFE